MNYIKEEEELDKIVVVKYEVFDYFRLPKNVDLDDVYLYYIRSNTLYLQMEEDSPIYFFYSERKGEKIDLFKKPNEVEITWDFDENQNKSIIEYNESDKCFYLEGEKYENIKINPFSFLPPASPLA